jgi:hypothetical protein
MQKMDKMIAEMSDAAAKKQATMHLDMSKAEMKKGNEAGCLGPVVLRTSVPLIWPFRATRTKTGARCGLVLARRAAAAPSACSLITPVSATLWGTVLA